MLDKTKIQGFTLIELSIVLVIIGLLVGGVLVGRDLIHAAELRSTVSQVEKYNAAVNAFRLKFNCLPGDCAEATVYGLGTAGGDGDNGDGDGYIRSLVPVGNIINPAWEFFSFWYHLSKAKLITWSPGPNYTNNMGASSATCVDVCPSLSFSASNYAGFPAGWGVWVNYNNTSNYSASRISANHYFWITAAFGSGLDGSAVLVPADAYAIDKKIDDGLPYSGSVNAAGDINDDPFGPWNPAEAPAGGDGCVSNSLTPMQYNVRNFSRTQNNMCSLLIRSTF